MCDNGTWRGNIPHCTPHTCTTYPCNQEEFCVLERSRPTCYQGSLGSWDGVLSVCYYQYHYWGYFNPHKYAITICLALAEVHPCTAVRSSLLMQQIDQSSTVKIRLSPAPPQRSSLSTNLRDISLCSTTYLQQVVTTSCLQITEPSNTRRTAPISTVISTFIWKETSLWSA